MAYLCCVQLSDLNRLGYVDKMVNKNFYNTVLSQAFSFCGNYLIVGDIYGQIFTFHLSKIINPDTSLTKDDQKPKNKFIIEEDVPINSLLATDSCLIVGTVGIVLGLPWKSLKASKECKPCFRVDLPNLRDNFVKADVNCLDYNKNSGLLYAGCGDNHIYTINIEIQAIVNSYKCHTNYIHSIFNHGNYLMSGGEDGLVAIWDVRDKNPINKIEPHKNDKIARPDLGKWIGAVSMNDDWLVCGGGPRLSLWHFRSLNNSTVFPIDDQGIHVAQFWEDAVLAGGRTNLFYKMNFNGDIISEIPTASVTVYSAVHQEEPFKALCLAGSSPKIDVCSNFNYRDQVLSLY